MSAKGFSNWLIDKIKNYPWDDSLPFEKMTDIAVARGTIEALQDPNYQQEVFEAHGLVLFMTAEFHSYFCLPQVKRLLMSRAEKVAETVPKEGLDE